MRKTIVYVVVLAMLAAGVYYLLPGNNDNTNPYDEAEAGFTIEDTAAIGKIFIAGSDGASVLVERTDTGWIVNKQFRALKSTLNMVLVTLMKQEPLYPVTQSAYDNAIKTLSTHSTKVEVYDRGGKKMKVFYVGGSAVNNTGTNMLMEGASRPYVVEAAGFVGYLTARYTSRVRDWRDRTVFDVPASDIASVSVEYAEKPQESFTVKRAGDSVAVLADKDIMNLPDGLNQKRAASYLSFFSNVNCEGFLNGLADNEETIREAPKYSTVKVVTTNGKVHRADIYWMAINKRSKNVDVSALGEELPGDYDSDRMYAVTNDYKDTVMVQQIVFNNILRKAKEFYYHDQHDN